MDRLPMGGKLLDPRNKEQRAIYLLKVVRAGIGKIHLEDPGTAELEEIEKKLANDLTYSRRYAAHEIPMMVVAIFTLSWDWIFEPEKTISSKSPRGDWDWKVGPRTARFLSRKLKELFGENQAA